MTTLEVRGFAGVVNVTELPPKANRQKLMSLA